MSRPAVVVLAGASLLAGCAAPPDETVQVVSLASPAPVGSAEPRLSAGPGGLALTWLESPPEGPAVLRLSTSPGSDGPPVWSEPSTVASSDRMFVNWADFPSAVWLSDGRLAAHWLVRNGEAPYAYGIRVAASDDRGATWSEPLRLHRDRSPTEHGFVTLVPTTAGGLDAVWLDGRAMAAAEHGAGATQLMTRPWDGHRLESETVLDPRVCDCCATAAVALGGDLLVAYRDRTEDEVRDISVVRRVDGAWSEPRALHDDGWRIRACPVNGPALAHREGVVAVAWFTASRQDPRVLAAFSTDGGASFTAPVRVDDGDTPGRVDVAIAADGVARVAWIATRGERAVVLLRAVSPDGALGTPTVVGSTSAGRAGGFPRIVPLGREVIVAWTEPEPEPRVRLARVLAAPGDS